MRFVKIAGVFDYQSLTSLFRMILNNKYIHILI